MVKSKSTSAIVAATGRSWESWVQHFDDAGTRQMDHTAIVALALDWMPESVEQLEWWAQSTAVAFGQYAGLRVPGQMSTGDFQLSTTRTVTGAKDQALKVVDARAEFGGVPIEGEASASSIDRWRYWRVALSDGSLVVVNSSDK